MARIGIQAAFLDAELKKKIEDTAAANGFEVCYFQNDAEALSGSDGCEVLFGSFKPASIKADNALKWLHCSFAGVDKVVDDEIYPNPDVIVTNSAGGYGVTIAEHMICVTLMMMRRMPEYMAQTARHGWGLVGEIDSIMRSTITIVGMGDIGTNFARRAKALGAACIRGVRRTQKPGDPVYDEVYTIDRLDEAIQGADVVALCVPGTEATTHLIDAHRLSLMKDGAYLVNVGRGWAVDQPALIAALEAGKLRGAALDVVVPEPLPADDPLWNAPNILITPHVSGNMTLDITREKVVDMFCENIAHYAKGEKLRNLVDRKAGY
ncbi:MAG: D-2-hydroxyacid dehydrogenase [Clostridia bacterium]|nr:D-2-hydroxyacid dehydrogenase [Clostridia bacterium]